MKLMMSLLMLFSTFGVLAADLTVIPSPYASCQEEEDDYRYLNRIMNVIKKEDYESNKLTVIFYTDHGRCKDGEYRPYEISKNTHITFWKEGANYPWTKYSFKGDVEVLSKKTAKVTIVFNLKKLFKKKSKRKIAYWFTPRDKLNYQWYFQLEEDENGEVSVTLEQ